MGQGKAPGAADQRAILAREEKALRAAWHALERENPGLFCLLDPKTRLCTVYDQRPDTCRLHPQKKSPKPGFCAYGRRVA